MDTLGIYISVPFCRSKCTFCNFASGVFPDHYHQQYIDLVCESISRSHQDAVRVGALAPIAVESIYFGGGTPSVLKPDLLRQVFGALREAFDIEAAAEITVECAPGQLSDDFLMTMLECGVNRVSFGVQSFVDSETTVTGRLHNRETALRDISRVQRAGIASVSADLIAGLPLQTLSSWRESLSTLTGSGVDHCSIYMLEVDDGSRLGRELIDEGRRYQAAAVPADELVAKLYLEAETTLKAAGFHQYEISNFAKPSAESGHNKRYWQRKPYLGFGVDAHSMLRTSTGEALRFQRTDDLQTFLKGADFGDVQSVSPREAQEEEWFLGLRLNEGVSMQRLELEYGYDWAHEADAAIAELTADGLIELVGDRVRLLSRGRLLSNEVFERFLSLTPDPEPVLLSVE